MRKYLSSLLCISLLLMITGCHEKEVIYQGYITLDKEFTYDGKIVDRFMFNVFLNRHGYNEPWGNSSDYDEDGCYIDGEFKLRFCDSGGGTIDGLGEHNLVLFLSKVVAPYNNYPIVKYKNDKVAETKYVDLTEDFIAIDNFLISKECHPDLIYLLENYPIKTDDYSCYHDNSGILYIDDFIKLLNEKGYEVESEAELENEFVDIYRTVQYKLDDGSEFKIIQISEDYTQKVPNTRYWAVTSIREAGKILDLNGDFVPLSSFGGIGVQNLVLIPIHDENRTIEYIFRCMNY